MKRGSLLFTLKSGCLGALLISLTNAPQLVSIFAIGYFFIWLIELTLGYAGFHKLKSVYISLGLFYLLHIVGLAYTEYQNLSVGLFDLEVKLSFLVFPLAFTFQKPLPKRYIKRLFKVFVIGLLVAICWHFIRQFFAVSQAKGSWELLVGTPFTAPIHYGYFAWYINFSIWLLVYFFPKEKLFTNPKVDIGVFVMLFFTLIVTSSKAGVILFLAGLPFAVLYLFRTLTQTQKKVFFSSLIAILALGMAFAFSSKGLSYRVKEVMVYVQNPSAKNKYGTSTKKRIQAWQGHLAVVKEHTLIGTGTGDVREEALIHYHRLDFKEAKEASLNAHNQYLQSLAELGIPGLLSLLLIFGMLGKVLFQTKNFLLFGFVFHTVLFALTESILEVQAGVVFFVLFALLLTEDIQKHDSLFSPPN